jgi:DNA-binding CsgD family transcriptional regulator/tetratricopeptide (TPR) repeat protein
VDDAISEQLLDREAELSVLAGALDEVSAGVGGLVLLEAGAGMGKTELLRAGVALARARGLRTLTARGGELERDLAFGVVRQLFEPALSAIDARGRAELLEGAARLAESIVAPSTPAPPAGANDSFATLHGLYWLTANVATSAPVVIAIDDAHWSDLPSLRFVAYLARRLEGIPALLAVAARGDEPGGDAGPMRLLAAEPLARVIRLSPLRPPAVHALVAARLGAGVDAAFARACHEATGGNPFLLTELVHELRAEEVQPDARAAPRVERMAPESVRRALLGRLARLPEGAGALARAVAVLGDGAQLRHVAALAGVPRDRAGELIDALAHIGVLESRAPLRFVHPLVRSAVASALGPAELARAHAEAARLLAREGEPVDRVAVHLLSADARGDSWAVETLREAARRAQARGAPDVAAQHLRRALGEPPPPDARPELLLELGAAESRAGAPDAIERLTGALEATSTTRMRARVSLELTRALFFAERFPEAVRVCERALADLGDAERDLALELEVELLGAARQDLTTRPIALERLARLDRHLEPRGRVECMLLANMANEEMAALRSRETAVKLAERSLTGGRLFGEESLLVLPLAVTALTLSGRVERSLGVWDEAIAHIRARGALFGFALASTFRGLAAYYRGDLSEATADARSALEIAESYGAQLIVPYALFPLVNTLLERNELAEADELLTRLAPTVGAAFSGNHILSVRGQLRLAQGRLDEAVADLRECGRRHAAWVTPNPWLAPWRPYLALAHLRQGDDQEASRLAAEELEAARRWGAEYPISEALRVAGLVAGADRGIELLRDAAAAGEASESRLQHARALTELGGALRREGLRRDAREPLRAGLDGALRCGATALAGRAHDELVGAGAQPRRLRISGVDALTPTERRVAGMAAEGMTNRAIAQGLFVSEKTVETHLGHAYRKLDVSSRSQLPLALATRSG